MAPESHPIENPDDTEAKMRRSLGLDPTSPPSPPSDPMKAARQAIRSQAAARDYAERNLAQAQADIQGLQTKLRQARQERDSAQETARSAVATQAAAERTLVATEAALAAEKTARDRAERSLTNAQATIRDLQTKLDSLAQALQVAQGKLAAEREKAITRANVVPQTDAAAGNGDAVRAVHRRPGRPRKTSRVPVAGETPGKAVQPVQAAAKKAPRRSGKPVKWWVTDRNQRG